MVTGIAVSSKAGIQKKNPIRTRRIGPFKKRFP